jgi:hypothetical protein
MSTYGKEAGGRKRVRCTRDAESGTCPAPHSFYLDTIEAAVLGALPDELRHPDVIAEFVRAYREERRRLAARDGAQRAAAERRLGEIRREMTASLTESLRACSIPRSSGRGPATRRGAQNH